MNFIKRAWQSIRAKKGRTFLLCAVFSAILIFVLAGLTIRSAALSATESAQKSVGATVTLSTNREAMFQQRSTEGEAGGERPDPGSFSITPVSLTDVEAIAALDNVKSYSVSSTTTANADSDIEPISSSDDSTEDTETDDSAGMDQGMGGFGMGGGGMMQMQSDFQITGVLTTADTDGFSGGTDKIVEGEGITADDEGTNNVVIESALAEANDLSVGDTFVLTGSDEDTTYEMTIKGIYETSSAGDSMGMQFNFMNPANTLYTSYTFANTLKGEDSEATVDSAVFQLEDPEEMDAFVASAEKLIDTDTFSLQTNDQQYQQMLEPLNNVASFAENIVLLVAIAGVIILTLIVMITIRERRYEIGVLLSLGESRFKVIMQFFTESILCMVVALVIASFSGNVIGNVVGEQLLSQQTEASTSQVADNEQMGGPGGGGMRPQMGSIGASSVAAAAEIDELNVTVEPQQIIWLAGIGILISFGSILLSSVGILRLQPKKILTT